MRLLLTAVLRIGDLFQPFNVCPTKLLHDRDMAHLLSGRTAVPMLDPRRDPHHIAFTNLLPGATPVLHKSHTARNNESLSRRMCVPSRTRTGIECDDGACETGRLGAFEQASDLSSASEVFLRSERRSSVRIFG